VASLTVFAPAKINLFLHVGEKRADGYHALQSLAVFAGMGDELTLSLADELTLSVEGPFAHGLADESDNLVLRAARALSAKARLTLTKNLPVASGIGGGSADAAAALRGLMQLHGLSADLQAIAATLGSDVPVCLGSRPAWMEGRGEILASASVPSLPIVLVNPGVAVSTAHVFRALETRRGTGMTLPAGFDDATELLAYLNATANDLEAPACAIQPVIGEVLRALSDAVLSRMSGSGATCFGIYTSDVGAAEAARAISAVYPGWWVRATRTLQ